MPSCVRQKTEWLIEQRFTPVNEGRGTIGKIVNDEETVKNLNEGLTGRRGFIQRWAVSERGIVFSYHFASIQ
jgi:hypothetical protein